MIVGFDARRVGAGDEAGELAVAADSPAAVEAVGAIGVVVAGERSAAVAVDEDRPDRRAIGQVAAVARHGEVVLRSDAEGLLGAHVEHADVVAALLARDPQPRFDRHHLAVRPEADPSGKEEQRLLGHSDLEQARVLEKERPLLGEEEIEPVEVDLQLVGLDLGEVGVVGGVQGEAGRQAVLEVDPELALGSRRGSLDALPAAVGESVGRDL